MPQPEKNISAMILGQFLGDAACLGTHWIYNLDTLNSEYPALQGFETPPPDHYHADRPAGAQTHYGEGAYVLLESVARLGAFNAADFGAHFIAHFTDPDYTGYCDGATKETLANYRRHVENTPSRPFDYQQGADDDQLATASRLAPVVAAHLNSPELLDTVEKATRVCQSNDLAIAFMKAHALLLRALLYGQSLPDAIRQTAEALPALDARYGERIKAVMATALYDTRGVVEATMAYGQACPLPQSFPSALHAAVRHQHSMHDAILATLGAGGDNAGRAAMIGAWLGAANGMETIPANWLNKLLLKDDIERLTKELCEKAYPQSRQDSGA